MRTNHGESFGHTRNSRIVPSKLTLHLQLYPRRFIILPKEKRQELVKTIDDLSDRLTKIIDSRRTQTTLRLRAIQVLNELVKTSYTMVRDVEVEELERETETLEEEEKRAQTKDSATTDAAEPP